ncbi:peptidoglycan editing factor PgeF [Granulicella sp. WH15]|uniref:peptidoglycan editing factor PgeF n=1 Tax=Granulicella sp. WH15 TaxID=2602070 RepID=UPI00136754B9|nr:peptidoglycan editing factor PgeF [Granulicella sp. WH15]QHN04549.1 peptidoglycan editing factor PgeF [Granulicella sp. WH15]
MDVVKVSEWQQYRWLRHGFSTRAGGFSTIYGPSELNLGMTKDDDPELVRANRARLVEEAGVGGLVTLRQVHSDEVLVARAAGPAGDGDGLMTDEAGLTLGIQTADCVPVLVADVRRRRVAAFHAGWRGTVSGIVESGVEKLRREFGSAAEDLVGAVGPAIGACCYTVGDEVRGAFGERFSCAEELFAQREGGLHLDLAEANRRQLMAAGVDRVTVVGECTACARVGERRKYFSHRAEKGFTGRMMSVIGMTA